MGKNLLHQLATAGGGAHAGVIGALCAELEAASWADVDAAGRAFPRAQQDGHRLVISLECGARVRIAVNFAAGVALIEEAGWLS